MNRMASTIAAVATAGVLLMPMGTAHAQTTKVDDPADATGSLADIRTVRVRHGVDQVRVRATFTDLRKHGGGVTSAAVFIDTRPGRKGPELALVTGLEYGTDYTLVKVRRWKFVGEPITCDHRLRLDYRRDLMTFRVARSCFEDPRRVRVAMRMDDFTDRSHLITDWMTGRRQFTEWLTRG
ncbi:hypothetical protein ncot_07360 [Nocardioides sp. JQ2195]|uniref:hypothetical protein n=1 Tax=Nocardioides sp. JQ2195 TaxID=2592334 RepID=UPI00143E26B9|nr:hypothetical protein [Nocardioides sp. JQ2195]QIX26440.1 hypothetical protein ncot_07360 [Nocardioides sp. JQ2195]